MAAAEPSVYFHIGLHKTGTTYVQNVLRANRQKLRDQQVLYPGGEGFPVQVFAVWDLLGRRPKGTSDARIPGAWQALVDATLAAGLPTTLISDEHLSLAGVKQVRAAANAFPEHEAHVIVTARDLGRILVSAWQEEVKNRGSWTWDEFASSVRDPTKAALAPARGFWLRQDLPAILETWESVVPKQRIHVVTVPPSGSSPDMLMDRIGSVVGFNAARLNEPAPWANETVGVAGTEVIRRLNDRLSGLNQRQYDRAMKLTVVRLLAERSEPVRFSLPEEDYSWVRDRGDQMTKAIQASGYDIVGDIAELESKPTGGRRPDDPSDAELLEAGLTALAGLSERFATVWWARKEPDEEVGAASTAKASSGVRALVFRSQRAAAGLADRNRFAGRAMEVYLRARAKTRQRSRRGGVVTRHGRAPDGAEQVSDGGE
jgi:hypothetical protein